VNGSLHPASREQVAASGIAAASDASELAGLIAKHGWAALSGPSERRAQPLAVGREIARVVAKTLEMAKPECLVVFGGDTVYAVLREMRIGEVRAHAELLPGAPVSTIPGMLLVTKAGGFGSPDYLARLKALLA
jgi:uncharacterized protein YgbK (DUF1537 family)